MTSRLCAVVVNTRQHGDEAAVALCHGERMHDERGGQLERRVGDDAIDWEP